MPIHYRFDERWGIVVTTLEGEVTAEDLSQHAEALAKDPRARSSDELADLTRIGSSPAPTEAVRGMGERLRETDTNRPGGKFALVAPADAAFGMARLYQIHREHEDIQIRVFRGLEDALRWLGIEGGADELGRDRPAGQGATAYASRKPKASAKAAQTRTNREPRADHQSRSRR